MSTEINGWNANHYNTSRVGLAEERAAAAVAAKAREQQRIAQEIVASGLGGSALSQGVGQESNVPTHEPLITGDQAVSGHK